MKERTSLAWRTEYLTPNDADALRTQASFFYRF